MMRMIQCLTSVGAIEDLWASQNSILCLNEIGL
jgi:hypothetical protein